MTGSTAIDVVISLTFIFLLYSLLASIIQEIVTNLLGLRSKMLLKSIARMLDDGDPKTGIRQLKLINFFVEAFMNFAKSFIYPFFSRPLTKNFYDHPTIKYLGESTWNDKPAYLRAGTFANTLLDLLKSQDIDSKQNPNELIKNALENDSSIPKDTRRHLKMLFHTAGGDLEKFKYLLEEWFNEVQERASGWFKKQAQLMLFIIGLVLAIAFNVDTIAITKILANNDKVRERFVEFSLTHYEDLYAKGTQVTANDSTVTKEQIEKTWKDTYLAMKDANAILGLGRHGSPFKTPINPEHQSKLAIAILGWILTAFAISLGAPFWFDLLNKVATIRSSIKPRAPTPAGPANSAANANNNVPPGNRVG